MAHIIIKPAVSRRLRTRRRRGLTLFGALMALTLFAAAVVGAVSIYNTTTEVQRRNSSQALLTTLTVAVGQIYQGTSSYGTNMVANLAARGAIPSSALAGTTANPTIRHPFGGAVTVVRRSGGTQYAITFEDLDDENCAMLIDPYTGQAAGGGGLEGVEVGGSAIAMPLTPNRIRNGCNNGVGANDLTFVFE